MEFGAKGTRYVHAMLQQYDIPITYGKIDTVTYELMKQFCKESTLELVEDFFVVP
jgi:hypothetical protein